MSLSERRNLAPEIVGSYARGGGRGGGGGYGGGGGFGGGRGGGEATEVTAVEGEEEGAMGVTEVVEVEEATAAAVTGVAMEVEEGEVRRGGHGQLLLDVYIIKIVINNESNTFHSPKTGLKMDQINY